RQLGLSRARRIGGDRGGFAGIVEHGMREALVTVAYPWLKALHIIAVIAWMAGLLYLPRLFVYHAGVPAGSNRAAMLRVMERRLLHGIMAPAAIMTYGFGLLLAATPGIVAWRQGWIWAKLAL